jgi:hypothetical protein
VGQPAIAKGIPERVSLREPRSRSLHYAADARVRERRKKPAAPVGMTEKEEAGETPTLQKERQKMPGFPTQTVGTPIDRGKARRYKREMAR